MNRGKNKVVSDKKKKGSSPDRPLKREEIDPSFCYPVIFPSPSFALSSSDVNSLIYENFQYSFQDNRLISSITGQPYVFSDNYDAIGTYIAFYVQAQLQELNLQQVWIPEDQPTVNIFKSPDLFDNPNKLLIIIQGKGEVRPGQWSRKVCINDNLDQGTMIPYIVQAFNLGYSILVLNPNIRKDPFTGKEIPINSTSQAHCNYVWEKIVKKTKAREIFVAAHSFGGVCAVNLIKNHSPFFKKRVKAIALLDSVHKTVSELNFDQRKYFQCVSKNWKKSPKPLSAPLAPTTEGCTCVSAGDTRHEYTSAAAIGDVFMFFNLKSGK